MSIQTDTVPAAGASPDMRTMIAAHDWHGTALGPREAWPAALRSAVSMILASKFPMYIVWGPSGVGLYNDAFIPVLGGKHPAALGMPIAELWSEIWDQIGPLVGAAYNNQTSYFEDLPVLMDRHGYFEQTYFTFSYSGIEGDEGKVEGMFCVCLETTAAYNAGQQRISENEKFQRMFAQAPGFMAVLRGPAHVFEMANDAYLSVIGWRDIIGKPVAEALPEVMTQGFGQLLDEVFATRVPFVGEALRYDAARVPGGPLEETYVSFVYQPIVDEEQHAVGIFVQGHDVTARCLAERGLLKADAEKDRFIATLAHELRNPLSPIRNAVALMDRSSDQQVHAKARQVIHRQVDHLSRLVDDLLDVARISQGKLALHMQDVELHAVLNAAMEAAAPAIAARGQALELSTPAHEVWTSGDAVRLAQALGNLLHNASKFSPQGGRIALHMEAAEPGWVRIAVSDNGIGISPASMPTIFDMFQQGDYAPDRLHEGLGIGLSLVATLMRLHGGAVDAASGGTGEGSTFTLRLPVLDAARGAAPVPLATAMQPGQPRPAVLLVDDNAESIDMMRALLTTVGYTVHTADNGHDVLALARMHKPQAILLDIGMPGMDGYTVARMLRALPEFRSTRLIAHTGFGAPADRERSASAGFDFHLVKPASLEDLERVLK
ncbi:MAG: ATP-binding protein [Telluria sp.]